MSNHKDTHIDNVVCACPKTLAWNIELLQLPHVASMKSLVACCIATINAIIITSAVELQQ